MYLSLPSPSFCIFRAPRFDCSFWTREASYPSADRLWHDREFAGIMQRPYKGGRRDPGSRVSALRVYRQQKNAQCYYSPIPDRQFLISANPAFKSLFAPYTKSTCKNMKTNKSDEGTPEDQPDDFESTVSRMLLSRNRFNKPVSSASSSSCIAENAFAYRYMTPHAASGVCA